jgi:hypothetical protein
MTIGRPQMDKQIRGYNQGGIAGLGPMTPLMAANPGIAQSPLPTGMSIPSTAFPDFIETEDVYESDIDTSEIDAKLLSFLKPKDYEEERKKYEKRFSSLIPARQKLNFYDLASELGAAILSRPQDEGVFTGVGIGFNNFNKRISQADKEEKNQRQSLALKAAELAMRDEKEAEKALRDYAIEVLKSRSVSSEPKLVTLTYDEVGDDGQFTGKKVEGSFDKVTQANLIRKLVTQQNGVVTSDLPDPLGESDLSKEAGKDWLKDQKEIRSLARTASSTLDMINEGKLLADALGEENFGKDEAALLPIKQFVAGFLPRGIIDTGKIGIQEALAQVTIGFTLANVAQTKGAISNREMDLFKEASPYLGQSYEGFMLALDIQERVARKKMLFATEYQAQVNKLYKENPRISGQEMQNAMNNFVDKWQKEGRDLFLTDEDIVRINAFNERGKELGLTSDYSNYESRMNNALRRREIEEENKTNRFLNRGSGTSTSRQDFIDEILSDDDLTKDQKLELIRKAMKNQG